MATPFVVNPDVPNYAQVIGHHSTARAAIDLLFSESNPDNVGQPPAEMESKRQRALKMQAMRDMMALLAFLEACFKLDYGNRKRFKLKDSLSKALIRLFNRKNNKAALMEDIVKSWLREGALSHYQYNRINSAFTLRNWIAHGQYWSPKKIQPHDFFELAEFIEGLINSDAFESDSIDLAGA